MKRTTIAMKTIVTSMVVTVITALSMLSELLCGNGLISMVSHAMDNYHTVEVISIEPVKIYEEPIVVTARTIEPTVTEPVVIGAYEADIIDSVTFVNHRGLTITTSPVYVNADKLMNAYCGDYENCDWDCKGRINTLSVLWEFLVNQQGVSPANASGILGNIAVEGLFGEEQKSYRTLENIDDARLCLGKGDRGYGIAQWTFASRQSALLDYYELTNDKYDGDWEKAKIVAECCMLLEEIKNYGIFENIEKDTSIEDATGRVSLLYEGYEDCSKQWKISNGVASLISSDGSGDLRLEYAENIYNYFTK